MRPIFPLSVWFLLGLHHGTTAIDGGNYFLRPGEVPYVLGLLTGKSTYHCGATLLAIDNIQVGLTTATCASKQGLKVAAGDLHEELFRRVDNVTIHPGYNNESILAEHDIAVLFFIPFEKDEIIYPAELPSKGYIPSGNITVSGRGDYSYLPNHLSAINQTITNETFCRDAYAQTNITDIPDDIFCGMSFTERDFTHQGDSGGPAFSENGYLAGIFQTCYGPQYPALYINVGNYLDWIEETVEKYKYPNGRPTECPIPPENPPCSPICPSTEATNNEDITYYEQSVYYYYSSYLVFFNMMCLVILVGQVAFLIYSVRIRPVEIHQKY